MRRKKTTWRVRTHGAYAAAYVGKDARRPVAYCAPSAQAARARAAGYEDIARASAVAKGATCQEAKKAAQKLAVAKAAKCPLYFNRYEGNGTGGAIVEVRGRTSRVVARRGDGAAVIREIDRLTRKNCPKGTVLTPAERKIR